MTSQSNQPDRGTPSTPTPTGPTPDVDETPLPQHAPPVDVPTSDLLDGDVQPSADPADQAPEKDVEDWTTGDEPMTGPQHSYLQTLAREAGEDVPDNLTKAQASQLNDRLQART